MGSEQSVPSTNEEHVANAENEASVNDRKGDNPDQVESGGGDKQPNSSSLDSDQEGDKMKNSIADTDAVVGRRPDNASEDASKVEARIVSNEDDVNDDNGVTTIEPVAAADEDYSSSRIDGPEANNSSNNRGRIKTSIHAVKQTTDAVKRKTTHAAAMTMDNTKKVWHQTEEIVDNNVWCLPLRWVTHFRRDWPRTSAFIFAVVVPLWALIFIAMAFGALLAEYEKMDEIEGNNAILAARAKVALDEQRAIQKTLQCAADWGSYQEISRQEQTTLSVLTMLSDSNVTFNLTEPLQLDDFTTIDNNNTLLDCISSDDDVGGLGGAITREQLQALAFESLSFNWNRCWNRTKYETEFDISKPTEASFVFHPTEEQMYGTRPAEQYRMFSHYWKMSQQEEFERLLPSSENATAEEIRNALELSIELATGEGTCKKNVAATAWFFFTIMTTVGYGNQAPVTFEGRNLVIVAGIFSLILFAAVLGTAGYVLTTIFDDLVGRFWLAAPLTKPGVGVIVWGTVWIVYARSIGHDVQYWWERRLPEFGADTDGWDALWFAYISTTTIGLGDYYLQPELVFTSDALKYSVLFMIGFVFLSTFLNKLAETVAWMLPKKQNSLEARLKATRALACWRMGLLPWENSPEQDREDSPRESKEFPPEDQTISRRIKELKKLLAMNDNSAPEDRAGSLTEGDSALELAEPRRLDLVEREETIVLELLALIQDEKGRLADRAEGNLQSSPMPMAANTAEAEDNMDDSLVFEA